MTVGDPRGIGPEVVAKALADQQVGERCDIVVVGPSGTVAPVVEVVGSWSPGDTAAVGGRLSGLAIERAVALATAGDVDGIVTAPIDKSALLAGGYDFPGHTEMLAELTHSRVAMMLASDKLRVVLATTHMPLRDVVDSIDENLIVEVAEITRKSLREWFGVDEPRIALCALNPHAGDGGRFGSEDDSILRPAAMRAGIDGPFAA